MIDIGLAAGFGTEGTIASQGKNPVMKNVVSNSYILPINQWAYIGFTFDHTTGEIHIKINYSSATLYIIPFLNRFNKSVPEWS